METNKLKNTSAFPIVGANTIRSEGMDLRDYFAAKAITSVAAEFWNVHRSESDYKKVAESAYLIADAMLKQRETH